VGFVGNSCLLPLGANPLRTRGVPRPKAGTTSANEEEVLTEHGVPDEHLEPHGATTDGDGTQMDLPRLLRLTSMMQSLMLEAHDVDLDDDEPARRRLAEVQRRAVDAIMSVVPTEMADELRSLAPPIEAADPTEGELRIAQSQVIGWLAGLFQAFQLVALEHQVRADPSSPRLVGSQRTSGPYL